MSIIWFNVGDADHKFTVEVHHCGFFVGQESDKAYIGGKVNWFDHCEVDTWSPLWFLDFVDELKCPKIDALKIYWLLSGIDLGRGLRVIELDSSETLMMTGIVDRVKNLIIHFDHDNNMPGIN